VPVVVVYQMKLTKVAVLVEVGWDIKIIYQLLLAKVILL
jgi:hypothetical protein